MSRFNQLLGNIPKNIFNSRSSACRRTGIPTHHPSRRAGWKNGSSRARSPFPEARGDPVERRSRRIASVCWHTSGNLRRDRKPTRGESHGRRWWSPIRLLAAPARWPGMRWEGAEWSCVASHHRPAAFASEHLIRGLHFGHEGDGRYLAGIGLAYDSRCKHSDRVRVSRRHLVRARPTGRGGSASLTRTHVGCAAGFARRRKRSSSRAGVNV